MTGIPDQKHSNDDLDEIRRRNAFSVRPPVQQIKNLAVHPGLLAVFYLLCLTAAGLAVARIFIPALACAASALVVTVFIFFKKPRSHHHAAIIAIISLLVLVFGTVYYLEQFEQTAHDAQGPIRY